MSRKHVRIFVRKGEFYIEDLKTINKTYINGKVITKPTKVKQDDLILIGETELEFKILH
jgi:pSer/pThr/pTyr-binding forkhead associated (FHA) protein